jgi:hypothetical protein
LFHRPEAVHLGDYNKGYNEGYNEAA